MEIALDKLKEECGIFGIFGHEEAAPLTQLGLFALQHRGQEACGIVSCDKGELNQYREIGLVADVLNVDVLKKLTGSSAIGHTRYSTAGKNTLDEVQPFSVTCQHGQIAVCHNGNLPFAEARRRELERDGAIFSSTSDTETILHGIARTPAKDAVEAITKVLKETEGAFSLLFLTPTALIAVRDPRGFRPLVLGKYKDAWCVASETCAFDLMDAEYIREVEPGEMIIVDADGMRSSMPFEKKAVSVCTFEHVYFSRPDSIIYGRSVNESRHKMGKRLAEEHPVEADLVVPVPDSGVAAAIGYARWSGINFRQAIIRNHYVGRTFIEPSQSIRSFGVRLKLNPIKDLINGNRIILVDDSIVRGTTSKKIVEMIRHAGAREVHMRISCPPTAHSCYYGVDTPHRQDLIASRMTVEEIREYIGVDTLGYLSLEGMLDAIGLDTSKTCSACWTGKYPTLIANGQSA
ncbi:MAG: amidophosphoribosyltransferase [Acidobacteria bacterium]|nr:amidophosphoribosyltransferase [Acidobacteriota bacterium]MBK9527598.1 amidophosphoribosyltransferase [Acidobacteriota bacterium]MBP7475089.1 amidophosphoribosyltransferase [Pyrinomonadaceae bacterium]MBP9109769.1 amidophosphoribosyltransferase [Pyrinomonadaceae bacterium]